MKISQLPEVDETLRLNNADIYWSGFAGYKSLYFKVGERDSHYPYLIKCYLLVPLETIPNYDWIHLPSKLIVSGLLERIEVDEPIINPVS